MEALVSGVRWRGLEDLRPALKGFLKRRCRDGFELDDVVQETLLRAARYRRTLCDPTRLRGWTLRIAVNVLRDRVRRETRIACFEVSEERLDDCLGREPIPGDQDPQGRLLIAAKLYERKLVLQLLSECLEEQKLEDRNVLRSYYGGHQSCAATAADCQIPIGLVKVRLFRARQRLLRALRKRLVLEEEEEQALEAVHEAPSAGEEWVP